MHLEQTPTMNANTKSKTTYHVAFDCGNSSFRIILGSYENNRFSVEVIDQIPHQPTLVGDYLYWDIERMFTKLKAGLKKAYEKHNRIDSVGVTTWGIDFALLDTHGSLIAPPLCYRNPLGEEALATLNESELKFTWAQSGIQNHPMNSLYQILGIKKHLSEYLLKATNLLYIPDLIVYLFTGKRTTERSIASTSQLYCVPKDEYSQEILQYFGIPESWLSEVYPHGTCLGWLSEEIQKELGIGSCPFICTPSHDTASAVTALPTEDEEPLFISSGTWSLIGAEIHEPILSNLAHDYQFANEAGFKDTITFLKNSTGLYILQEMKKHLEGSGYHYSWNDISHIAQTRGIKDVPIFDPNHPEIFSTRDMLGTLSKLLDTDDIPTILSSCYLSLATCYNKTIQQILETTNKNYTKVYIVGGGCRDRYLNQLTSDVTALEVYTGPSEAASLGNLVSQLLYFDPSLTITDLRKIVINSTEDERECYTPTI